MLNVAGELHSLTGTPLCFLGLLVLPSPGRWRSDWRRSSGETIPILWLPDVTLPAPRIGAGHHIIQPVNCYWS